MARALSSRRVSETPTLPPGTRLLQEGRTPNGEAFWRFYNPGLHRTTLIVRRGVSFDVDEYRGNVTLPCCKG